MAFLFRFNLFTLFSSNCLLSQALFQSQKFALTFHPWLLTDYKKQVTTTTKKETDGKVIFVFYLFFTFINKSLKPADFLQV